MLEGSKPCVRFLGKGVASLLPQEEVWGAVYALPIGQPTGRSHGRQTDFLYFKCSEWLLLLHNTKWTDLCFEGGYNI